MNIIENYTEVIKDLLLLLDTMEEGIIHSKKQVQELRYEEALGLLQDVMMGVASIEKAMEPMSSNLAENNIDAVGAVFKGDINKVVDSYETGKEAELENQVGEVLVSFKNWKEEIESILIPYVAM